MSEAHGLPALGAQRSDRILVGLSVHMTQVHKETLTSIENALPNRAGLDVEIFGMEGVPDDVIQQHHQRLLQKFAEEAAERRAATGNPAPGSAGATGVKKPKIEGPSDLKKRLAEHKAKKAVDPAAGVGSGNNTPLAGMPEQTQSPGNYVGDCDILGLILTDLIPAWICLSRLSSAAASVWSSSRQCPVSSATTTLWSAAAPALPSPVASSIHAPAVSV